MRMNGTAGWFVGLMVCGREVYIIVCGQMAEELAKNTKIHFSGYLFDSLLHISNMSSVI